MKKAFPSLTKSKWNIKVGFHYTGMGVLNRKRWGASNYYNCLFMQYFITDITLTTLGQRFDG